jgi:hypothetical protein
LIGIDDDLFSICCALRLLEDTLFQPLVVYREPVTFPFEQLDRIATTVQKYENATISHLVAKVFLYQATESIEAFAEVGMAMEPKIFGVRIDV